MPHGNTPSSTNEPMSAGDAIDRSESIRASCVPAFTNTTVPANMPSMLTQKYVRVLMRVSPINKFRTKNGTTGINRSVNR